jgi:hypothetical protein
MQLQEQLNKMMDDYSNLNKSKEDLFNKSMKDIDKLKNKEHVSFLKESLIDAKSGELDINSFLKKINTLKDVG